MSPLLFVRVKREASKQATRGCVWEKLYAEDLALTGESREEVEEMFGRCKEAMKLRRLKVNVAKTKLMVNGG